MALLVLLVLLIRASKALLLPVSVRKKATLPPEYVSDCGSVNAVLVAAGLASAVVNAEFVENPALVSAGSALADSAGTIGATKACAFGLSISTGAAAGG